MKNMFLNHLYFLCWSSVTHSRQSKW